MQIRGLMLRKLWIEKNEVVCILVFIEKTILLVKLNAKPTLIIYNTLRTVCVQPWVLFITYLRSYSTIWDTKPTIILFRINMYSKHKGFYYYFFPRIVRIHHLIIIKFAYKFKYTWRINWDKLHIPTVCIHKYHALFYIVYNVIILYTAWLFVIFGRCLKFFFLIKYIIDTDIHRRYIYCQLLL